MSLNVVQPLIETNNNKEDAASRSLKAMQVNQRANRPSQAANRPSQVKQSQAEELVESLNLLEGVINKNGWDTYKRMLLQLACKYGWASGLMIGSGL